MKPISYIHTRGFTLVETLVAISILLVAIIAPMTIVSQGLQTAFFGREQITAFYLAQEGVEMIFALRAGDAADKAGDGTWKWYNDIDTSCKTSGAPASIPGCRIEITTGGTVSLSSCATLSNCLLRYSDNIDSSRGVFAYNAGPSFSDSLFTRVVKLIEVDAGKEAQVIVEVSWPSGLFGGTKTVTLQTTITNQYDFLNF